MQIGSNPGLNSIEIPIERFHGKGEALSSQAGPEDSIVLRGQQLVDKVNEKMTWARAMDNQPADRNPEQGKVRMEHYPAPSTSFDEDMRGHRLGRRTPGHGYQVNLEYDASSAKQEPVKYQQHVDSYYSSMDGKHTNQYYGDMGFYTDQEGKQHYVESFEGNQGKQSLEVVINKQGGTVTIIES